MEGGGGSAAPSLRVRDRFLRLKRQTHGNSMFEREVVFLLDITGIVPQDIFAPSQRG